MTGDEPIIDGYVDELGATVRSCVDCGALVGGGPSRCARCADVGDRADLPDGRGWYWVEHYVTQRPAWWDEIDEEWVPRYLNSGPLTVLCRVPGPNAADCLDEVEDRAERILDSWSASSRSSARSAGTIFSGVVVV